MHIQPVICSFLVSASTAHLIQWDGRMHVKSQQCQRQNSSLFTIIYLQLLLIKKFGNCAIVAQITSQSFKLWTKQYVEQITISIIDALSIEVIH